MSISINNRNEPKQQDGLITISEFCKLAKVSRSTFYRLRDLGQMPTLTYIGDSPRIRNSDYETWVEGLTRST